MMYGGKSLVWKASRHSGKKFLCTASEASTKPELVLALENVISQ